MPREDHDPGSPEARRDAGVRFVRRMYLPRALGLALGGLAIGVVLWRDGSQHPLVWAALASSALVWPHVAYGLGRASRDPRRTELCSLTVDSALGGAWIAAIKFNLVPSAVLFAMLSMDKLAVGGMRFLARGTAALIAACLAVAVLTGFALQPHSGTADILGVLPLLLVYPMTVGYVAYRLAQRVREQNRLLTAISRTDGLTGLLNRHAWEEAVAAEFERCRRSGRSACVLMLDIDHFKAINDLHGHPAGDEAIRKLAGVLRATLRKQDVPGRYGGEEFGVLLPETVAVGAEAIAERVRRRVESAELSTSGIRATVSIGIAQLEAHDADYGAWIAHADRALYAAKGAGRNRSILFSLRR